MTFTYATKDAHEPRGLSRLHPAEPDLLSGCKVEASSSEPNYGPQRAVDGHVTLESSWRATPYPQWIRMDMGAAHKLKAIKVWPYWGGGRYYQYSVEVSTDGATWEKVGDKLTNTTPASEAGDTFEFDAKLVRLVRINVIYNNLNKGVHIVEIKAIEAK
jgi:hypothetical protein